MSFINSSLEHRSLDTIIEGYIKTLSVWETKREEDMAILNGVEDKLLTIKTYIDTENIRIKVESSTPREAKMAYLFFMLSEYEFPVSERGVINYKARMKYILDLVWKKKKTICVKIEMLKLEDDYERYYEHLTPIFDNWSKGDVVDNAYISRTIFNKISSYIDLNVRIT